MKPRTILLVVAALLLIVAGALAYRRHTAAAADCADKPKPKDEFAMAASCGDEATPGAPKAPAPAPAARP